MSSSLNERKNSQNTVSQGNFNSNEIINEIYEMNRKNISEPTLCIYKFIANKNEKVSVKFDTFDVKSLAPEYVVILLNEIEEVCHTVIIVIHF